MTPIRIFIAAVLLIWTPFSGALAAAVNAPVTHHHCTNVWHGHTDPSGIVMAGEECATPSAQTDFSNCDDCQVVLSALPFALNALPVADHPPHVVALLSGAQHRAFISLFRPPRA